MKLCAQASGLQGKYGAGVQSVKSALVATSTAARHRRVAFKPARIVRVAAAEPEPQPEAAPAGPRKAAIISSASLKEGQEFEGTVTAVQSFGAFVNFGADKDGLVHVSQLSSGFVGNAADVVKVGDKVNVRVLNVDPAKGRIALTMKGLGGDDAPSAAASDAPRKARKAAFVNAGDLKEGDELEGTVTSVQSFGAFVDIGAEKDGMVHISQLKDGFVKNAGDVVKVGDAVKVRVLSNEAGRLSLSMKGLGGAAAAAEEASSEGGVDIVPGEEYEGTVTKVESFGAFVNIGAAKDGLVHISQLGEGFVENVSDAVSVGQVVKVRVLTYDPASGRIALSMKANKGTGEGGLKAGQKLEGTVTKVGTFGVFVNIGAEKDGLVHISQLPVGSEAPKEGDVVSVTVLKYDPARGKISLSMTDGAMAEDREGRLDASELSPGQEISGTVTKVEAFGAFVDIGADKDGLVHISQLGDGFTADIESRISVGDSVTVRVLEVTEKGISLTMRSGDVSSKRAPPSGDDISFQSIVDLAKEIRTLGEQTEGIKKVDVTDENDQTVAVVEAFKGHSFVFSELDADVDDQAETGLFIQMRDSEDDSEFTVEALEELESGDINIIRRTDAPVPLQELVEGKVLSVDASGIVMSFEHNGVEMTGFLARDEAKVPFASLSAEDQKCYRLFGCLKTDDIELPAEEPLPEEAGLPDVLAATPQSVIEEVSEETGDWSLTPEEYEAQYSAAFAAARGNPTDAKFQMSPAEYTEAYNLAVLSKEAVDAFKLELVQVPPSEEDAPPVFVDAEGRDLTQYYKVGDSIQAMVLAFEGYDGLLAGDADEAAEDEVDLDVDFGANNSGSRILLTQFADWEVEQDMLAQGAEEPDAADEDEDAEEEDTSPFLNDDEGVDLFTLDPAALLEELVEEEGGLDLDDLALPGTVEAVSLEEEEIAADEDDEDVDDADDAIFERAAQFRSEMDEMRSGGRLAFAGAAGGGVAAEFFPSREVEDLDEDEIAALVVADLDKNLRAEDPDGDENILVGVITEDVDDYPLSKATLKRLPKYKYQSYTNEAGEEVAVLDEDGAPVPVEDEEQTPLEFLVDEDGEALEDEEPGEDQVDENGLSTKPMTGNEFLTYILNPKHDAMVAELVRSLMDTEDEAEIPITAYRAPAVLAVDMASISAAAVKDLRTKTGAGMMDCKKALAETGGNVEQAMEWLRKKGLAGADKKAGRVAAEGAIVSYIHPGSRLGVMLEVNCETDFVAASDTFQSLAKSVAMQIAASPNVQYISVEEIPAEVFEREKQIEMGREDLKSKPEAIRAKIAEGRAQKIAQEMALLPQPYLKDGSKTVEQAVKEAIAAVGEKISLRRFVKFQLGEGIEKRSNDFAAEVAAATGAAK